MRCTHRSPPGVGDPSEGAVVTRPSASVAESDHFRLDGAASFGESSGSDPGLFLGPGRHATRPLRRVVLHCSPWAACDHATWAAFHHVFCVDATCAHSKCCGHVHRLAVICLPVLRTAPAMRRSRNETFKNGIHFIPTGYRLRHSFGCEPAF